MHYQYSDQTQHTSMRYIYTYAVTYLQINTFQVKSQIRPAQLFQMSPSENDAEHWKNFTSTISEFYSSREDWCPTILQQAHCTTSPSSCDVLDVCAVKDQQYFDAYYSSRRPFFLETVVSESSVSLPTDEYVDGCPFFTPYYNSRRPFYLSRVASESTVSLPAILPSHGCEIASTSASEEKKKSGRTIWRLLESMCVCIPRKNQPPLDTSSRSSTSSCDVSDVFVSKDELSVDAHYSSRSPFSLDTSVSEATLPSLADNSVDRTSANEAKKKSGSKLWRRIKRVFACFPRKKTQ